MAKNSDVTINFIKGYNEVKTKHLFFEKLKNGISVLYSYGYHFPLCIKLLDNTFLINLNGYSNTTARHKSLLCYALNNCNFKQLEKDKPNNILFFDTEKLKEIINKGFINKNQIIEEKI